MSVVIETPPDIAFKSAAEDIPAWWERLGTAYPEIETLFEATSVDAVVWPPRVRTAIPWKSCLTLADMARVSDSEWLKVPSFGRKTLGQLRSILQEFAISGRDSGKPNAHVNVGPTEAPTWSESSEVLEIPPAFWAQLVEKLRGTSAAETPIGALASNLKIPWPQNRFDQPLSTFLRPKLQDLWKTRGLGKRKIRTIIKCALAVSLQREGRSDPAFNARQFAVQQVAESLQAGDFSRGLTGLFDLAALSRRERKVLEGRYGLNNRAPRTLEEVAADYNLTRERIRQVESNAHRKIIRSPGLKQLLTHALATHETAFLHKLEKNISDFIYDVPRLELLRQLGAWEALLIEILHPSVEAWLDSKGNRTAAGWLVGRRTLTSVADAEAKLSGYLASMCIPVPAQVIEAEVGLSKADLALAEVHGNAILSGDFVSATRLSAAQERALLAHSLTRRELEPLIPRRHIAERLGRDTLDPSQFRTVDHDLGSFDRLLVRCGREFVMRVAPQWERDYPELIPQPPSGSVAISTTADEERNGEIEPENVYAFGLSLFEQRRLWRTNEIMAAFAEQSKGRYAGTSFGAFAVGHPLIDRAAPGIWARNDLIFNDSDYEFLLTDEDCTKYILACRANADRSFFRIWNTALEQRFSQWAQHDAPTELFQSLLSIINPTAWDCSDAFRQHWLALKHAQGRFRFQRPPRKALANLPVLAHEFFGSVGDVVTRRGTSWMDLNIVHGRTIDSHRPASHLALLVAIGAVISPCDWQQWHQASDRAAKIFHELCNIWVTAKNREDSVFDWLRNNCRQAPYDPSVPGWVDPSDLESLIQSVGTVVTAQDEEELSLFANR